MDPYDLLVEDCWLHLFQFVSAEDKQALCCTCGAFQGMLEPEKVKWGLELVLPYILKKLGSRWGTSIIALKSILNLRLVCKVWREGFDRFIVNGCSSFSLCEDIKDNYCFGNDYDYFYYDYIPEAEKFVTYFKNHSGNPFIGRSVSIYAISSGADEPQPGSQGGNSENESVQVNNGGNEASNDVGMEEEKKQEADVEDGEPQDDDEWEDDDEEEMRVREWALKNRQMIMELLSKFGEEIDHLYLGRNDICPLLEAYKFLQIVLCNCSNLQSLDVKLFLPYLYYEFQANENDSGFQNQLEKYFEVNPLPKMHRLRDLQLCQMNAHLEKLMLEACGSNLENLERLNSSEIPVSIWASLKCLRYLSMSDCRFEQMEIFLRAINSPLEALILEGITYDGKEHFKIDKFLLAIQHLPLRGVVIYSDVGTLKESAPFPDDFPKHKTISYFSIGVKVFNPDFLQFLPELQSFSVNRAECLWKPSFSK